MKETRDRLLKYMRMIVVIWILGIAVHAIMGEQLLQTTMTYEMQEKNNVISDLDEGSIIEQPFVANMDVLQSMTFQPFSYQRENSGLIEFFLLDKENNIVATTSANAADCVDYMPYVMTWGEGVPINRHNPYVLRIVVSGEKGFNPSFYYTTDVEDESNLLSVNGEKISGQLCLGISGYNIEWIGTHYWYLILTITLVAIAHKILGEKREKQGKFTFLTLALAIWNHYSFLIEQLVARDFKVKYKRSLLGYLWSFLNPLFTMLVQYIVFSTVFRFGIDNFPVYLLSGNIIFGFFTEAVGQGLMSIVGNASLITKVYVPKYIYPITKVFSASINLWISLIPLLMVTLITGEKLNLTILLLPYALICLLIFCTGVVLILSAINVFFRDVQYLWNIVSLVWMYATPIFYPADIIPEKWKIILTLNPIYQVITFMRSILMNGVSPAPEVYINCFVGATISLLLGVIVFKKTQDKFVLYI